MTEPDAGFSRRVDEGDVEPRTIGELRKEAAEAASALVEAYVEGDMAVFHLSLGRLQGLGMAIYGKNAKLERCTELKGCDAEEHLSTCPEGERLP